MKNLVVSLSILLGVLFGAGPLLAHHGEANYDTSKFVSLKGTLTDFKFMNPHVQVTLNVKNEKGEMEKWVGEARSPNMLVRYGLDKNTLKLGDVVTVTGHRAKNGSHTMRLFKIALPDGHEIAGL